MSRTLLGIDGPLSWTDTYHYRADGEVRTGYNTKFNHFACVDPQPGLKFFKLVVRTGGRTVVATGSFKAMWSLWLELGLVGDTMKAGQAFKKAAVAASIVPLRGKGETQLKGRESNGNLPDLVVEAGYEECLDAWQDLNRLGWKAEVGRAA